ncbi:MAG TPA: biotin transporter BioY [Deltaproteobacteria bacterium]|nr:biotin transporter BioY [Deltaproteobacteria bacterium]HOM29891.1 biotin transporter BioY [Deltaproteobacteria bacterium]HPP79437.1 biotin transporter BioY [Deltaproteobacteria bacterium]
MDARKLALVALFAALTAVGALIKIPLWPVPMTMQTFFVLMAGIVLGPRHGTLSQAVYILVGLMGLPVFSGGGGPSYLLSPTMGYLIGFVLAAWAAGLAAGGGRISFGRALGASVTGTAAIYLVGVPYLALYMHLVLHKPEAVGVALKTGLAVFVPGDILKCLLLTAVAPRIAALLAQREGRHARHDS